MRVLAKATQTQLMEFRRRGLAPKDAVDALLAEAKRRFPECETVIIQPTSGGIDIIGL